MYNSKSFLSLFEKKLINEELLENSGLLCKLKLRQGESGMTGKETARGAGCHDKMQLFIFQN